MKTAIIGGGFSGLAVANGLGPSHDFTLFEAAETPGGYARAIEVRDGKSKLSIDMGFTIFNDWSYPLLNELLDQLGLSCQDAPMGFSVTSKKAGINYSVRMENGAFQLEQKLFRPKLWGMISEIKIFQQQARKLLAFPGSGRDISIAQYLKEKNFSNKFRDFFILPLCTILWPTSRNALLDLPLEFLLKFLDNHGMLSIGEQPQWLTIREGSQAFIDALCKSFSDKIKTRSPILKVVRGEEGITLHPRGEAPQHFDRVVMATPADQALQMLEKPSDAERETLGSFCYQTDVAMLHSDTRFLPKSASKNAIWHFQVPDNPEDPIAFTRDANLIHARRSDMPYCVTRQSASAADPTRTIKKTVFQHLAPSLERLTGQLRFSEINGKRRTYYAGAYWFGGYAEDAIRSGQRVVDSLR